MKKILSLLLSAMLVLSLIPAMAITASAAETPIKGVVTEMAVNGNTIYVYAPESEWTVTSATTAPCFMVFGDKAYTTESAEAEALSSGLANLAAKEGATVVFINPQGDAWSEADVGVYTAMIDMYSDSSSDTFENGIAESVNFFTGEVDTKILGGYQARIYLYAEGSGADFVAANYMKSVVIRMDYTPEFSVEFDRTPTAVNLFNPTALPEVTEKVDLVVSVVNGPADTANKLASLTDYRQTASSAVTDGFDRNYILDSYSKLAGAYRRQVGLLLPMHDYAAEGIVESIESVQLKDGSTLNYVVFYDKDLPVTGSANPVPLVLAFHGGGESALSEAQKSEWPEIAQAHGFIAVSVDCHTDYSAVQIVELVEHLKTKYAIDASRVYGSGFSMGSIKSWDLFEQCPTVFAGVAPMDGSNPPGIDYYGNPVDSYNTDVVMPVFYLGGQDMPSGELAHGEQKIQDRIAYAFSVNGVKQNYSYNENVNYWWGVNGDLVYQVTDKVAFKDSTLTVNLFQSVDGKCYTAMVDSSHQSHEVYARNSWAAWDFLSQFSRNADGSISISPVTYTLASDDGQITSNSYNTYKSTYYSDVSGITPYAEAIEAVTKAGLMNGIGGGKFAPNSTVTRAQAVAVLYRLVGAEVSAASPFEDVAENAWYRDYVVWAYSNNIVEGIGGNRFAPNNTITSEHLDLILSRTAKNLGVEYTGSGSTAATVTRADLANRLAQLYTAMKS